MEAITGRRCVETLVVGGPWDGRRIGLPGQELTVQSQGRCWCYFIYCQTQSAFDPRRSRSVQVAIEENTPVTLEDVGRVERRLERQPWVIDEPESFLGDFDQWFAWQVADKFGQLWRSDVHSAVGRDAL